MSYAPFCAFAYPTFRDIAVCRSRCFHSPFTPYTNLFAKSAVHGHRDGASTSRAITVDVRVDGECALSMNGI